MTGGLDEERLSTWLAGLLERPGARVVALERLSGGASRETWAVTIGGDRRRREPLIVQCARPGSLTGAFAGEARLLQAAARRGVPVPAVLGATDDEAVLGRRAIAVERLEGETVPRRLLRDDRWATARSALVGQTAAALAAVHRVDPATAPHLRQDDPVAQLRQLHDAVGGPHPVLEVALRWLEANRPPAVPPAVVHGDARLGNLLVGDEGLVALLDWELAHLGDPAEDLAWACVKAWRFGRAEPALGLGSVEELLEAYEGAGGGVVDEDRLRWWLVLGTLRWGVICELQVAQHLSGRTSSVELAAIGRRVCETEHDLLDLLGLLAAVPAVDGDAATRRHGRLPPHDVPSAADLVAAVAGFLRDELVDGEGAATARVGFHARVAANALAVAERELRLGPEQARLHEQRLRDLGMGSDAELAEAIRAGAWDHRTVVLGPLLSADVVDKLRVANPGYLDTPPADPWR